MRNVKPDLAPRRNLTGSAGRVRLFTRTIRPTEQRSRFAWASRQPQQFAFRFGAAELLGFAHNVAQSAKQFALLVDEQFRVTHDVDENDMADLELDFFLNPRCRTASRKRHEKTLIANLTPQRIRHDRV
jgi:hypothetical protein